MNVLSIAQILLSISVMGLALLQLTGAWANAINVFEPLVGVLMLIQAAQNWEKRRGIAYFSLFVAIFIFVAVIFIFPH